MSDLIDRDSLRAQARTVAEARAMHQRSLCEAIDCEVAALGDEQCAHDRAKAFHEMQTEQRRNIAECTADLEDIAAALRSIPHQATP